MPFRNLIPHKGGRSTSSRCEDFTTLPTTSALTGVYLPGALGNQTPRMTLLLPSLLVRFVAMMIHNTHSPTAAFQKYLNENPWSLEARMYDI